MIDLTTYEAMRSAVLSAHNPIGIVVTSALYENLDYGPDHFSTAGSAIHGREEPKQLYQLPVSIRPGADHFIASKPFVIGFLLVVVGMLV